MTQVKAARSSRRKEAEPRPAVTAMAALEVPTVVRRQVRALNSLLSSPSHLSAHVAQVAVLVAQSLKSSVLDYISLHDLLTSLD